MARVRIEREITLTEDKWSAVAILIEYIGCTSKETLCNWPGRTEERYNPARRVLDSVRAAFAEIGRRG